MTIRQIGEVTEKSSLWRRMLLVTMAAIFFLSVTAFAVPPVMRTVLVADGKKITEVKTSSTDASFILAQTGVKLDDERGDSFDLSEFSQTEENSKIVINRGVEVTLKHFDGSTLKFFASGTVADALERADYKVPAENALSVSLDEKLTKDTVIEIYGVYTVTVECDGSKTAQKISAGTVKEALKAMNIALGEDDFTSPELDSGITGDTSVEVFRAEAKQRTEIEYIDYDTDYTYTDTLFKDHTATLVDGVRGEKELVYKDFYVNGELVKSEVVSEKTVKEPQKALVQVGTKTIANPSEVPTGAAMSELTVPSYVNIGQNGVPVNYSKVINAKATAYCIPGGITSTGKVAQAGYIAVDPNEIPYGTEMYIVSADGRYVYGYCIAADTGGFIYDVDWTVDLFMNSEAQCINWGRRDIIIYIL